MTVFLTCSVTFLERAKEEISREKVTWERFCIVEKGKRNSLSYKVYCHGAELVQERKKKIRRS